MANSKISGLTGATTPLAGTETLPIVQSGATVKVPTNDLTVRNIRAAATTGILQISGPTAGTTRTATVPDANWTAARTDTAQSFTGDQTLSTGNLVQGTAAKGINFTANTPAAGMTSQLLNWYEEGTWTPADASGAGLVFVAGTTGVYTKIGRVVYVSASVRYPVTASAAAALIAGLPFTMAASPDGATGGLTTNYSPSAAVLVFKPNNGTQTLVVRAQSGGAQVSNASMSNTRYDINGFYNV